MVTVTPRPVAGHRLAALAFTVVLVLHGIAHFAGLVDSLDKADAGGSVDYLAGAFTLSDPTMMRVAGAVWATVGTLMVLSALLVLMHHRLARPIVLTALVVSLTLSVVGSPAAIVGVGLNLALLALVTLRPNWVDLDQR